MFRMYLRQLRRFSRRLVVRIALIALLALVAMGLARVIGPFLPQKLVDLLSGDSLDTILNTLAASMLTVTTFSLSVMTGAFQTAASSTSPRSLFVLREDGITHLVLASFVGAFLFSLLAIILRATPIMGPRESAVLFLVTIFVVGIVILSIIRWIHHLERFGSLDETTLRIQDNTKTMIRDYHAEGPVHARAMSEEELENKRVGARITAAKEGYVTLIACDALDNCAEAMDRSVFVAVQHGEYVHRGATLAYLEGSVACEGKPLENLRDCFEIEPNRLFEMDPRFGVQVLAEIASRALSPGINDPGTAVDVVNRLGAVMMELPADWGQVPTKVQRVWIRPLRSEAFFQDSFDVIARDGAGTIEVMLALRASLQILMRDGAGDIPELARACWQRCESRAAAALKTPHERDRLGLPL